MLALLTYSLPLFCPAVGVADFWNWLCFQLLVDLIVVWLNIGFLFFVLIALAHVVVKLVLVLHFGLSV